MVADRENAALASRLIQESCLKQDVLPETLTLHSGRGPPTTSKGTVQLHSDRGITRSLGRPRVSADNPFPEAHFKTVKYHPSFPGSFPDIGALDPFIGIVEDRAPTAALGDKAAAADPTRLSIMLDIGLDAVSHGRVRR